MNWIEALARERGTGGWQTLDDMVSFGKAVAAKERERIEKLCEVIGNNGGGGFSCAAAIRALGDE